MVFRSRFSSTTRVHGSVFEMRLSPGQEGLVVLGGDRDGLDCMKQVIREEFKVRHTKELSDVCGFSKS